MTVWVSWEIEDEDGENPLEKPGEFDFNVELDYDPGDPGYQYDRNGDGYPGYPPKAVIVDAKCLAVRLEKLPSRAPTVEETKMLAEWFLSILNDNKKLCRQIEECGLDQMCVEQDYDDWDD
jgi:hypothetical protein